MVPSVIKEVPICAEQRNLEAKAGRVSLIGWWMLMRKEGVGFMGTVGESSEGSTDNDSFMGRVGESAAGGAAVGDRSNGRDRESSSDGAEEDGFRKGGSSSEGGSAEEDGVRRGGSRSEGRSAEEDGVAAVGSSHCGKGFYCYTDMAVIQDHFEKGLPLSAFVFNNDYVPTDRCLVWIAFGRSKGNINIVPLQYAEASVNDEELCGLGCATCTLHLENTYQEKLSCLHERISSHCLLLPFVKDKANRTPQTFDSKFAMVHDDWDVLTSSGKGEAAISSPLFNV